MVGLFSACLGDVGGKMGVSDEEEREDGKPGEGVSGVTGLEGGNDDGLEFVSSVELNDSLRMWVYLAFCTSSIIMQGEILSPHWLQRFKVFLSHNSKFPFERRYNHLSFLLTARALHPSVWLSVLHSLPSSQKQTAIKLALSTTSARWETVRWRSWASTIKLEYR